MQREKENLQNNNNNNTNSSRDLRENDKKEDAILFFSLRALKEQKMGSGNEKGDSRKEKLNRKS